MSEFEFIRSLRKSECSSSIRRTSRKNKRKSVSPLNKPISSNKFSTPRKTESPVQIIRQDTPFLKFHQNNENIVHIGND
jgi:hypothetical protein